MDEFKWRDCYAGFLNLDHRTDRLAHMVAELNRVDLRAVRHRGRLPQEYDLNDPNVQVMRNRTPGAISCHFGQVEIMQTALSLNTSVIVFEDDLIYSTDIKERLDYIETWINEKQPDFDVFWLGGTFHNPPFWHPHGPSKMSPDCSANIGKDFERTNNERIVRTYGAFSTFAYIVNVKSIDKILKLFDENLHKSIGIDFLFISLQPQLKTFAFLPGCVKQIDNMSDIGNGMTIFSGFSRLNGTEENSRYWFQDKMSDYDPKSLILI